VSPDDKSTLTATAGRRSKAGGRAVSGVLRHRAGVLPLLAASILWGVWNTADKYAVTGLPVMTVVGAMLVCSAAMLWAVALFQGLKWPQPGQLKQLALAGLLDPAIAYGAMSLGLVRLPATAASLLDGTEACFVVAMAAFWRRRRPTARSVIGVLLSASGVAALGGAHAILGLGAGDLLVLAGVASAALSSVIASRVLEDLDPVMTTACQFGFGLLFTTPLIAWQWTAGGSIAGPDARPADWVVAAIGCGGTLAAAFLLYNRAIARIPVTVAGAILNVSPLFGVAAAVLLLGEGFPWWQALGAALILGGIFLFAERDVDTG
jgi:drug/metabolite transporter (DMT)-like permease